MLDWMTAWPRSHFTAQHGSRGTYCTCTLTPSCQCQHKNRDSATYITHKHTVTAATPWGVPGEVHSPPKKITTGISGTTQALYLLVMNDFCASHLSEKVLVNLMLSYSFNPSLQNGMSKPLVTCTMECWEQNVSEWFYFSIRRLLGVHDAIKTKQSNNPNAKMFWKSFFLFNFHNTTYFN